MTDLILALARKEGYSPDSSVTPGEVGGGRPYPFMIYENAVRLGVYPMAAIVKVGDTLSDIHEGLNAGCWSVGVAATGNLVGLSEREFGALPPAEKQERLRSARAELAGAGAHFVVDSVAELDAVLDEIDLWLKAAEGNEVAV
jgi:phosphonoacetaldehyde hydrolase